MKRIIFLPVILVITFLSACQPSTEEEIFWGTWKQYESTNSISTVSYDTLLCPNFTLFQADPLEYVFSSDGKLRYRNLGASCPDYSECTYKIEGNKLILQSSLGTSEMTILKISITHLELQKSPLHLSTIDKFVRTN